MLCRGLEMLKSEPMRSERKLLVYSTCSLNPIEDEAVVAAALSRFGGGVRLRPLPPALRPPRLCAGLASWRVPHPAFGSAAGARASFGSAAEAPAELLTSRGGLAPTMFPPTDGAIARQLPLCARALPHQLDSGGFFVALFERLPPAPPLAAPPPAAPPIVAAAGEAAATPPADMPAI